MSDNPVKLRRVLQKADDWRERRRAARLLRKDKSSDTVKALLKAVDDIDNDVVHAAIISLTSMDNQDLLNIIDKPKILESDNPSIRWAAANAFGKLGNSKHFEFLSGLVDDPDWTVRNEAISAIENIIILLGKDCSSDNLKILIRMLHIDHPSLHDKVVDTIILYGTTALYPLTEALNAKNELVIKGIVRALGGIGDIHSAKYLIPFASDESADIRKEVVNALGRVGKYAEGSDTCTAINTLVERLGDGNKDVVNSAINALVFLKDDPVLSPILFDGLNNIYNIAIKKNIFVIMGRLKLPEMKIPILHNLGNTYYLVRKAAVKAVAEYGEEIRIYVNEVLTLNETPIEPLVAEALQTENVRRRIRAIKSLGQLKNPLALDTLLKLEQDEIEDVSSAAEEALFFVRDAVRARANAAFVLGELGGEKSIHILSDALADESSEVRWSVIVALRKIRSSKVVKKLADVILADKVSHVRGAAVEALGGIGVFTPEIKKVLLKALKDEIRSVRATAARILGRIPDDDVIDALIETFKDQFASVRTNALNALYNIGEKVIPKVKKELKTTEIKYVKLNCLILLGVLKVEEIVPELKEILKNEKDKEVADYLKAIIELLRKKAGDKAIFEKLLA
ncbi:HEAT repeat domain-containing protein [candidate division KSB1 bacterium]